MAENRVRDWNRVRDMYEGVNEHGMNKGQRKEHRDETLRDNPDVLFRIYRQGRLHVLLFRPTDTVEWKNVIHDNFQDRIQDRNRADPSVQLTERRAIRDILPIISMSGPEDHLEHICDIFDQLFNQVQENIQIREAQRNQIEEFIERILAVADQLQITMAEIEEELQILRRQLSEEVRRNATQDEGAAAQNNPEDDVEKLRERIRELELENRRRRGLQDD